MNYAIVRRAIRTAQAPDYLRPLTAAEKVLIADLFRTLAALDKENARWSYRPTALEKENAREAKKET